VTYLTAASPRSADSGSTAAVVVPDLVVLVEVPAMQPIRSQLQAVHWILRIAVGAEFVGHGAFGIITKADWVPYFGVVGIPEAAAWTLMPVVGAVDIALGVVTLVRPMPVVLLYMAAWGLWTALLRPLSGEGIWEFLERAGNYGVPFAFLLWSQPGRRLHDWFSVVEARRPAPALARSIAWVLRVSTAALLIGHGGFGAFMQKAAWIGYLGAAGIGAEMVEAASLVSRVGWFEIALGLLVLAWPAPGILIVVFAWKVGTELLRPVVGEPFWELVERAGSYAAPLALLFFQRWADPAPGDSPATSAPPAEPVPAETRIVS
jgi:hypothetical protein